MSNVYDSLVREAFDKIYLFEYKRADFSDHSCKYAYLGLLQGEKAMYRVEYNGNGHNYQAVIDGFHRYYKQYPSDDIIKDYQAALEYYARFVSVKDIQDVYNILDYELTKEEKGEASFKINVQPVLKEMYIIITKFHGDLCNEKKNFDKWINQLNDDMYKKHGYMLPINTISSITMHEIAGYLKITGVTKQFQELCTYLRKSIKENQAIKSVIERLEEAVLKEVKEYIEYVEIDGKKYFQADYEQLQSSEIENIVAYLGKLGCIIHVTSAPTISCQLTGCSKDIFACTTYYILSYIADREKELLNISDEWTLDLKVPQGGKRGLTEYEMIIMRIFPWIITHQEPSSETTCSLTAEIAKNNTNDTLEIDLNDIIEERETDDKILEMFHHGSISETEWTILNWIGDGDSLERFMCGSPKIYNPDRNIDPDWYFTDVFEIIKAFYKLYEKFPKYHFDKIFEYGMRKLSKKYSEIDYYFQYLDQQLKFEKNGFAKFKYNDTKALDNVRQFLKVDYLTMDQNKYDSYKRYNKAIKEQLNYDLFEETQEKTDKLIEPYDITCPHCGKIARKYFKHVYLCYDCGQWHTVSNDDKTKQVLEIAKDVESNIKDHDKALELLLKANELCPKDTVTLNKIGVQYFYTNPDKSIDYLNKALEVDPDYYWNSRNIAVLYYRKNQYTSAIPYCYQAISLLDKNKIHDSEKGGLYALYAECLEKTKQSRQAFQMLMIAYRYNSSEAYEKLEAGVGMTYWDKEYLSILHKAGLSNENIHFSLDNGDKENMKINEQEVPYVYFKPDKEQVNDIVIGKKMVYFRYLTQVDKKINLYYIPYRLFGSYFFKLNNDRLVIDHVIEDYKAPVTSEFFVGKDGPIVLKILESIRILWFYTNYEQSVINVMEAQKKLSFSSYKFIRSYSYLYDQQVHPYTISSYEIRDRFNKEIKGALSSNAQSAIREGFIDDTIISKYTISAKDYEYARYGDRKSGEYKYSIRIDAIKHIIEFMNDGMFNEDKEDNKLEKFNQRINSEAWESEILNIFNKYRKRISQKYNKIHQEELTDENQKYPHASPWISMGKGIGWDHGTTFIIINRLSLIFNPSIGSNVYCIDYYTLVNSGINITSDDGSLIIRGSTYNYDIYLGNNAVVAAEIINEIKQALSR